MNIKDIRPQMRVTYVPFSSTRDIQHKNAERGIVSAVSHTRVYMKFDKHLAKSSWDDVIARACDPDDIFLNYDPNPEEK